MILLNRTSNRCTILIPFQVIPRDAVQNIEIRVRIQVAVSKKLKSAPMKLICSRLGNHADDSRGVAAILCRVVTRQDAELFYCIGVWVENLAVVEQVVVDTTVQEVGD